MTLNFRQTLCLLNKIAFSEGKELDDNMKMFFNIERLDGESDEQFLDRADEIICGDFSNGNL